MFSLGKFIALVLIGCGLLYLWRSGQFTETARRLARNHCEQLGLQLLDDSMVISGMWPMRNSDGRLVLRRTYRFEFASTGDQRYRGRLVLEGLRLRDIELDAYRLPPQE